MYSRTLSRRDAHYTEAARFVKTNLTFGAFLSSVGALFAVKTVVLRSEKRVDAPRGELVRPQHGAEGEDDVKPAIKQALREGVGVCLLRGVGA